MPGTDANSTTTEKGPFMPADSLPPPDSSDDGASSPTDPSAEEVEDIGEAKGWNAITDAMIAIYGDAEPQHVGTTIKFRDGGPDPLDGISVFSGSQPPHWHFVTYGFSELYVKESPHLGTSGFGFELTFRVKKAHPTDSTPPIWAIDLLQNLARYVFGTGNIFGSGHHLNLMGPIAREETTAIHAILFVRDAELPPIDTAFGTLEFLQIVGITLDELEAAVCWNTMGLVEFLAQENPLLVTDLARKSVLDDPAIADKIRQRTERDGSMQSSIVTPTQLSWHMRGQTIHVTLEALGIEEIGKMLDGRIRHGREFTYIGPESAIEFRPESRTRWAIDDDRNVLTIELAPGFAKRWRQSLKPIRGTYRWPELPGLVLTVVPTDILDGTGNVVRTVG